MNIVDAALFGLSGATAIMIGQSLGADDPGKTRQIAFKTTMMIFILVATSAAVIYPFKRSIASFFASDPAILDETEGFLQLILPTLFRPCVNSMSIARGSGHAFPTAIDIGRIWIVGVALGYFLAFIINMGSIGIWLPFSLSNVIGGIILILWVKYGEWDKAVIRKNNLKP